MDSRILYSSSFFFFFFSFFSLAIPSRSLSKISLNLLYHESLESLRVKSSDSSLLSLHSLFLSVSSFHNFKNNFSIENSQMNISILYFSQLKSSPLRHLIGFSNLARSKPHSYPSLQMCPSPRLLHISK